jgi:drug/metabolite transporter (DMT)-like permease
VIGEDPIVTGTVLAIAAAVLFGASTPAIQWASADLGPFETAALLYLGAATLAATGLRRRAEAPLRVRDIGRLGLIAGFGAFLAPVLLAFGLGRTSGTTASLLLNLEAVFTVLFAVGLYGEHVGRRVTLAVTAIAAGGALSILGRWGSGSAEIVGLLAVAAATACWAADNALSRPLADLDGSQVVFGKGVLGASLSLAIALVRVEPRPGVGAAVILFACGFLGYGASLRLYLLAQRRLGAARTGSVFAIAPFFGGVVGLAIGQPLGGILGLVGAGAMAIGVYLHLTEEHDHEHTHAALAHEHLHRHDDGHHDHVHDPMPAGAHSHPHEHASLTHRHSHADDLHHRHTHG